MTVGQRRTDDTAGVLPPQEGLANLRSELLLTLPRLLNRAMQGYSRFAAGCPPDDPKGFVAYQAGCRAALSHVQLLVKLAHWARANGLDEPPEFDADRLDGLIREAEDALRNETIDDQ
ncbi:MAG: hypothetical protein IPK66_02780 [Rhodospirillales bacterium]|nr:hypothetical protein [Rhodospirillales bacterium]